MFKDAADAWIHRNDPEPAKAYLALVAAECGAEVAEQQATELRNWCRKRMK